MKLTAEGVCDYFCAGHKSARVVGRIIVGGPAGPGAFPFDYFQNQADLPPWRSVPGELARAVLASIGDDSV